MKRFPLVVAASTALLSVAAQSQVIITGVVDGPLSGGLPKAVELYVSQDNLDLSGYALGSANNGNAEVGSRCALSGVYSAGDYVYVSSDTSGGFNTFFGFPADVVGCGGLNVNGDDVVVLLSGETPVDTFGVLGVDGSGQDWEYLDGWASRNPGTEAAGADFVLADWSFSGANALDGETAGNCSAATPVPLQRYTGVALDAICSGDNGGGDDGDGGPVSADILISAVFDGPLSGGLPKGIELYVVNDIADLSSVGVGTAFNGGGSSGPDFTLSGSADAGEYLYVASEADGFSEFLGFAPGFTSGALSVNGDDAIELFQNDVLVDSYGDVSVDGSGEAWEYLDGWAVRVADGTPTAAGFDLNDWSFSGRNALDGESANCVAGAPLIPLQTYAGGAGLSCSPVDPTPVTARAIYEIQGSQSASPLVGERVLVEAVVVGDFQEGDADETRNLQGFFIQQEVGDGDALTSDGIFVFEGGGATRFDVVPGQRVAVTGTVDERFDLTVIDVTGAEASIVDAGTGSIAVTNFSLSEMAGLTAEGDRPDLERFEGMLVAIGEELTITEQFNLDRFGEIRLVAGERPQQYTQFATPDANLFTDYAESVGRRSIAFEDGRTGQNQPIDFVDGFAPYSTATAPRMGDTTTGLQGVLDFSFGEYRMRSVQDGSVTFTSRNPRPEGVSVGGNLKVASFNVLNFFRTLDDGGRTDNGFDPRGADSAAEFDRQEQKLIKALMTLDADIVGLIELENDFSPFGDDSTASGRLVQQLNAALGANTYALVDPGAATVGGDAIAVGLIYKPGVVKLADATTVATLDDAVVTSLPGDFAARLPIFDGPSTNRVPLAASFEHLESGDALTVAVNHFKSKGGSGSGANENINDGAGSFNGRRVDAAQALLAWLDTQPTGLEDDDVIILGDLNAYAQEAPITTLLAGGFNNVESADDYSFVFDGQIGTLDYVLISDSLLDRLNEAAVWHINADEADALDYNLDFGRDPAYFDGNSAARNSDHDPLLVGFTFEADEPTPVEPITVQDIIDQVNAGIRSGELDGAGRFSRFDELRFLSNLRSARFFARRGWQRFACSSMRWARLRVDGQSRPRDLLVGPGRAALLADIERYLDESC